MSDNRVKLPFSPIEHGSLLTRLYRECRDAVRDFVSSPLGYIRVAFLPDSPKGSIAGRLLNEASNSLKQFFANPVAWIRNAGSPYLSRAGVLSERRVQQRHLVRILVLSVIVHMGFLGYVFYLEVLSPFARLRVVTRPYEEIDVTKIMGKLRYPPNMLRAPSSGRTIPLDELREKERKRREEMRRKREEEEREAQRRKEEEERIAREAAEAEKKAADAKSAKAGQFGEINDAPIKDLVAKIYSMQQAGQLDLQNDNFTIMLSFKVESDGSIPPGSIKVIKSSGSKILDKHAIEILWRLGESRALGPLSILSSNTIQLELTEAKTRLTITSFAPNPGEAKRIASSLNFFLGLLRGVQKNKNPSVAELLGMLRVTSDNNRVDAEMNVSRARAKEMMQAAFGAKPAGGPP